MAKQKQNAQKQNDERGLLRFVAAILAIFLFAQIFPMLSEEERRQVRRLETLHAEFACAAAQDRLEMLKRRQDPRTTQFRTAHQVLDRRDRLRREIQLSAPAKLLLGLRFRPDRPRAVTLFFHSWPIDLAPASPRELKARAESCNRTRWAGR